MGSKRYSMKENSIINMNYELLYISKSKCDSDWHSTAHFHPFTEIFYITEGKGSFQLDDEWVNVSTGDLIIINPNCLHTEKSTISNNPLEYVVLGIDNISLNDLDSKPRNIDSQNTSRLFKVLNYKNDECVDRFLNSLIKELDEKEAHYEISCKSLLTLFIVYILRSAKNDLKITKDSKLLNLECMKIKNYLDSNYTQNITLDFLAELSYLNKFHLVHTFTKQIGTSPINYLINKRIEESKSLLTTTNFSIRDISSIVGFSNSSYFSHMFKKITGSSPKEYKTKALSKAK
ncbi:AraC family transcriptional regulator [uncultured Clostridium sp.]|uniref:AraC family transcriptional regulator n=1 Tax=uncultured Clostridium sp. TaxID=59620 RepID=UPI0026179D5B|nr:AraC family transcriptional regulator [uncultured Clostridium sp.]